jgi:hypothetical protein
MRRIAGGVVDRQQAIDEQLPQPSPIVTVSACLENRDTFGE